MVNTIPYDREKAVDYALRWGLSRNPLYHDFTKLGGDSTNFISQCLYAGSRIMNYDKTNGWYYDPIHNYSFSWINASSLFNFLTSNKKKSVYAKEAPISRILIGDIVQLTNESNRFNQSLIITQILSPLTYENILVASHDYDVHNRALNTYYFKTLRFLHIQGILTE